MTLDQIKKYVNEIVYKEQSGRTMTEDDFNLFIEVVNLEMFNNEYNKCIELSVDRNIPLSQVIKTNLELNEFKVKDATLVSSVVGVSLPDDYKYYISVTSETRGVYKPLRMTDSGEINDAKYNLLVRSPEDFPLGEISGNTLHYLPTSIDGITMSYLRTPVKPFYDYCIKTSNNTVIYMPAGSYISGGNLYTSGASLIASGVTHPYNRTESETVELEWRETRHPEFSNMVADKILQKRGDSEGYQINKLETEEA